MKRQYELVYLVSPDVGDDRVAELHAEVAEIVERLGGEIEKTDNWGRRRLAYEIGRHREATYVLELIHGSGELLKEIDRRLKVSDLVIRHLIVRVDEHQRVVEQTRARRSAQSSRRRVARGLPPERQPGEGQRSDQDEDREDRREGMEDRR